MSLAYSRDRRTEDVDARIEKGHYALTEAVKKIARRHNLAESWLNEQATTAIPGEPDRAATTVYASQFLTVTGASPRHLLAMKLYAGREKDYDDIAVLMKIIGTTKAEDAVAICDRLFPGQPLKDRSRGILRDVVATSRAGGTGPEPWKARSRPS